MSLKNDGQRLLSLWADWSFKHPLLVLMLTVFFSYLAWAYTAANLTINTDTAELVAPEAAFQQNQRKLEHQFPHELRTLLLVVKAGSPELTRAATKRLERLLRADRQNFTSVYLPEGNAFFEKNGLLYLATEELRDLSDTFSKAQPFIGRIYQKPSLDGFFSIIEDALVHTGDVRDLPVDLSLIFNKISFVLSGALNSENKLLSWQSLIAAKPSMADGNGLILAKPKLDYAKMRPAEESINAVRAMEKQIQDPNLPPVKVSITGEIALEHDEITGMGTGTFIASIFSVVVVFAILSFAYRSIFLSLSTLVTLALGIVFSGAFAAVSVGGLNLISVAFAVSNIGLGVEYSIHYCLRYRDYLLNNYSKIKALKSAMVATSPSLLLCASTTAIGLYAFIPTDYQGVSELGLLAGTSLFICLCVTLMVLPVLLRVLPAPEVKEHSDGSHKPGLVGLITKKLAEWTLHYAKPIALATLVLAVVSSVLITRVRADFNPINLRDPDSESVVAFKELIENKNTTPMTLTVMTQDGAGVSNLQRQLEKMASVDKTLSVFDLVPEGQDGKLQIIEEMRLLLGFHGQRFPAVEQNGDLAASIARMLETINRVLSNEGSRPENAALKGLKAELEGVLLELEYRLGSDRSRFAANIQASLLGALPIVMDGLLVGLTAEPITLEKLPPELSQRWLSQEGWYRVQIFPKKDLNDLANMEEFITQVQSVAPDTTDLPVLYWESMKEVLGAFQQAIAIALVAIFVALMAIRRSITDTLLIMTPLILAGLFTMASTVLTQTPINFANVIALPLLLGFGVDNGIHMVEKLRHSLSEEQNIYQSSTARAMFYGALTTSSSFGGLAFSPHQGIASMGLVITMGIFWIVTCTFVILPSLGKLVLKRQM